MIREALPLLVLALALRLPGVWFGLPGIVHDDEWFYVAQAATTLETGSPLARVSPLEDSYINPTAMKLACALACAPVDGWLKGGLPGGEGARQRYRTHRGAWHVAGRVLSALLGAGAVLLTWAAARALHGPRAGLLAGALLALSPLHVRDSHFAVSDVAASTCGAALIFLLARAPGRDPRRWAGGVGAALGAACATKYSMGLLLVPAGLGLLLRGPRGRVASTLGWAAAGALGAFLLLFPAALLDLQVFGRSFLYQAGLGARPWPAQDAPAAWAATVIPVTPSGGHLLETLLLALGPLGLLLALAGTVWLARRRPELAALTPLWLVYFSLTPLFGVRFLIPLLPWLAVAAAALPLAPRPLRRAPLALGLVLLWPAVHAVRIVDLLCRRDTRADFAGWCAAELERQGSLELVVDAGLFRQLPLGPDGRIDPRLQARLVPRLVMRHWAPLEVRQLEEDRARGYRFVALSGSYLDAQPNREELVAALDRLGTRVLDVSPAAPGQVVPRSTEEIMAPWGHALARARPGPAIRVWALAPP